MADEDRSFSPNTVGANRAIQQGGGVGQQEMNQQQAPDRAASATEGDRTEPWDNDEAGSGDDLRDLDARDEPEEPRFGTGTQANLDPRDIGERDDPQMDWGEPEPGAVFSSNHTRRPEKTEAERSQGPKTRARNKDIINRRP